MVLSSINLITGASGFIGSALCQKMVENGERVRAVVRTLKNTSRLPRGVELIQVGNICQGTNWFAALSGVGTVVHLAGMGHIMKNSHLADFHSINVEGTESFALASAKAGVRRFIYVSSIGVNGERSLGVPFREEDPANPHTAYAVSKWMAEQALHKVSKGTGMEIVILRSPMVYGPAAPGNFSRLMRLIKSGLPLPFKGINNRRSFLYLGNLVDAIITFITYPLAAGETFLVSDGQDVSTPDLIKMIACAMKKKTVLFSLHPSILKALCKIVGKTEELEKLTGSLLVDSSKIRNLLGWKPPFTLEEGIKETVKNYN